MLMKFKFRSIIALSSSRYFYRLILKSTSGKYWSSELPEASFLPEDCHYSLIWCISFAEQYFSNYCSSDLSQSVATKPGYWISFPVWFNLAPQRSNVSHYVPNNLIEDPALSYLNVS